ncbi:MAG: hypothetical protein AUI01_07645 [Ktedonobacter sp. 13_2_20CM_2_56_8]|nr:MAG: hypothetical protein AUI01_07645 [Ktedonobacter sp. 13_2_20CM_2_56_8]
MLLGKETHFDATSQGLFRRAIAQSGAGHHAISSTSAQRIGQYLAEKLDVVPEVEAIAAVPSCAPNRSHRCWSGRRDRRFGWNHY